MKFISIYVCYIPEGDILIIAHSSSMELLSRGLTEEEPLDKKTFTGRFIGKTPFGVMGTVEQDCVNRHNWHRIKPPIPPLTLSDHAYYRWHATSKR